MRLSGSTLVFAVSLAIHGGLAMAVATLPRRPVRTQVVITLKNVVKPKPLPPKELPPPEPEPPPLPPPPPPPASTPKPRPAAPKAAPPPKVSPAAAAAPVFDSGLTLGGGGAGGFEVPAGASGPAPAAPSRPTTPATRARPRPAPAKDACSEPLQRPKPIEVPPPTYPESERKAGTSGKVRVEIQLDATGQVQSARVVQSLSPALDEEALRSARRARFHAATRCGRAQAAKFTLGIRFQQP